MLIIAPDLIEAMLEILQKTRSLATALAVVELQQQIIQAVYIKVRPSLFLFVCVCVCVPFLPCSQYAPASTIAWAPRHSAACTYLPSLTSRHTTHTATTATATAGRDRHAVPAAAPDGPGGGPHHQGQRVHQGHR